MRHWIAAGLLAASGSAVAQQAIVVTNGSVPVTSGGIAASGSITLTTNVEASMVFTAPPALNASDLSAVFAESHAALFIIADFQPLIGVAQQPGAPALAIPAIDAVWGAPELFAISGEGMALPVQQPDAVRRPLMPFDPHEP